MLAVYRKSFERLPQDFPMPDEKIKRVVLVHGVGNPDLGSLLPPVAGVLGIIFNRADLILNGNPYSRTKNGTTEIVEVNWSDLRRPMTGTLGVLRHFVWLISSMLTVPRALCTEKTWGRRVLKVYEILFQAFVFWVLLFPIFGMFLFTFRSAPKVQIGITIASVLVNVSLAFMFGRFWGWYKAGYAWAGVMLIMGAWAVGNNSTAALTLVAQITTKVYLWGQILFGVFLLVCELFVLFQKSGKTPIQRLGNIALLYFPFVILSGIAALIWSLSLAAARYFAFDPQSFRDWGDIFVRALHYDLRRVELLFTILISAIGVTALLLTVIYLLFKNGNVAKNGLAFLLVLMPILFGVAGGYFFFSFMTWAPHASEGADVLNIYLSSARRLLPFLPFCVGPLTIVLDVLGDVIFFLSPGRISIRKDAETRVQAAFDYVLTTSGSSDDVVIFCHSQGSVIVREVFASESRFLATLITVGSPLESIYFRFLGWRPSGPMLGNVSWINEFRRGDYIGGPITDAGRNDEIGPGGHTEYWGDKRAWEPVIQLRS